MRKLIINADDLGISLKVDSTIERCIKEGVVTSSTLISNAPAFEDGVRIAKQYPKVSVGVHLNLIEFAPLTNLEVFKEHGIVGTDGHFIEGAIFVVKVDDELKKAIFEEWDAQICKVESAGIIPTHCDSHQHTHTIPSLLEPLCRVLEKHNISKVRRKSIPSIFLMLKEKRKPSVSLDKSNAIVHPKRNVVYRRLHTFISKYKSIKWNHQVGNRFAITNSFFAFRHFYGNHNILHLGGFSAIIELMCHPGHEAYQEETESLMNAKCWLNEKYKLISYRDI
jgi:predicted glycoside hydrolase/deacetylase ChbG (UPF0249 family)